MASWDATNASEITSGAIEVIIKQLEALVVTRDTIWGHQPWTGVVCL